VAAKISIKTPNRPDEMFSSRPSFSGTRVHQSGQKHRRRHTKTYACRTKLPPREIPTKTRGRTSFARKMRPRFSEKSACDCRPRENPSATSDPTYHKISFSSPMRSGQNCGSARPTARPRRRSDSRCASISFSKSLQNCHSCKKESKLHIRAETYSISHRVPLITPRNCHVPSITSTQP